MIPAFARGLCDDAAIFPPGSSPLADAVPAHVRHRHAPYAELVGPLVISATASRALPDLLPVEGGHRLDLAVTFPEGPATVPAVMEAVTALPVDVRALEVAVPEGVTAVELVGALDAAGVDDTVEVFVEVPRDARRADVIAALATTRYLAKFRTGGVRAELYPDEVELAAAITAVVGAGVPYKATAGLHHAVRNTDPDTGFEQHGFLNLLLATDAALRGADESDLVPILADRDGSALAERVTALTDDRVAATRATFRSFGTCSVDEPLTEMIDLGLVPNAVSPTDERTV